MFLFRKHDAKPIEAAASSPLLNHLAGEFAPSIAGVWPDPHAAFLAAPASRRHLVCLAYALDRPLSVGHAQALLERPLKRAIRIAAPVAPDGLARALERLGERAWSRADYHGLLRLLAGRLTGKLLRHRGEIAVDEVRALVRLPQPLLEHGLGGLGLSAAAAGLVGEAYDAIARRDGEAAALALAPRWAAAETVRGLVDLIQDDLEPQVPPPPFPGTERLRPLASKAALLDAAQRYKNCLRHHLGSAGEGSSAYYEWVEEPGVVLEITQDRLRGWALAQARLPGNKAVPEPVRQEIASELLAMGVHIGRLQWQLDSALDDIARTPPDPVLTEPEVIAGLFGV